jgi:hypothetical protein
VKVVRSGNAGVSVVDLDEPPGIGEELDVHATGTPVHL